MNYPLGRACATMLAAAVVFVATVAVVSTTTTPAVAQKAGGTLRIYHRDNPPSASIHEEATISTNMPFMAIFNNLVYFDIAKRRESLDAIVPELAKSWKWNETGTELTMTLEQGVKWHDGKPFTAKDVVCTFDALTGKGGSGGDQRKNPRGVWYFNLKETKAVGEHEVTFVLSNPQPSFLALLASGYTPVYPCHVPARDMRTKPVGTGPFKFVDFKRNESIRVVKNGDYWKKGLPHLDAIEWRIISNRSTRILAFVAGEFDMTFDSDVPVPLLKDMKTQAPKAMCDMRPTGVSVNLIVNREVAPFDNPAIRKAMMLAIDRATFNTILGEGQLAIGAAMLPAPEGAWGMPAADLAKLAGYGTDTEANLAMAKKTMEGLGYGPAKKVKLKISTRNIPQYRDPAVILIDQLKKIYFEADLDVVDTTIWHAKVARKDYQVGLNLTGVGVDDPDVNFVENYTCKSERNYTQYCNPEVDKLIFQQSRTRDRAERMKLVGEIERRLIEDGARPIIYHDRGATCWHPHVRNLSVKENSIYNGWRFETVWLDK